MRAKIPYSFKIIKTSEENFAVVPEEIYLVKGKVCGSDPLEDFSYYPTEAALFVGLGGERWPSGLRRTPGTRVGAKVSRRFESCSLRQESCAQHLLGASLLLKISGRTCQVRSRSGSERTILFSPPEYFFQFWAGIFYFCDLRATLNCDKIKIVLSKAIFRG